MLSYCGLVFARVRFQNSLFSLYDFETIIDLSEKLHFTTDNIITDTPVLSDPGLISNYQFLF